MRLPAFKILRASAVIVAWVSRVMTAWWFLVRAAEAMSLSASSLPSRLE